MAVQLSMKAALSLAKSLVTTPCCCSNTGPWHHLTGFTCSCNGVLPYVTRPLLELISIYQWGPLGANQNEIRIKMQSSVSTKFTWWCHLQNVRRFVQTFCVLNESRLEMLMADHLSLLAGFSVYNLVQSSCYINCYNSLLFNMYIRVVKMNVYYRLFKSIFLCILLGFSRQIYSWNDFIKSSVFPRVYLYAGVEICIWLKYKWN